MELAGTDNYEKAKQDHQSWVAEFMDNGNGRDDKWTTSIAVGSESFVEKVKSQSGALAKGRDARGTDEGYQLREPERLYRHHFEHPKGDIGLENTYLLDNNI